MTTYAEQPLLMKSNRVWRTYTGGRMIEAWQGNEAGKDGEFPEEWVASTVKATNPGREHISEGLSELHTKDDKPMTLKELVDKDPVLYLGSQHAEKYKNNTAVLVKVIDSAERLTIQVHPDREFARNQFQSEFGKTEAWYILGGRTIDGEEPALYLGFKPEITRDQWKQMFEEQNIPDMLDALHTVKPEVGEVYLIRGGLPHAIGKGCILIEIQEPTDYTLRTERITPNGRVISDAGCHQGLGFDRMMDAFHYDPCDKETMLQQCKIPAQVIHTTEGGKELALISSEHTDRFSMNVLHVDSSYEITKHDSFIIAVVVSGSGTISWSNQSTEIKQSQQWFFPAGVSRLKFTNDSAHEPLQIVLCYPPES